MLALVVLLALFVFQRFGTARIGGTFGPLMLLWFVTIAVLGGAEIAREPRVLLALNPWYGIQFFVVNGKTGFLVLGAVVLAVTGAEALYADMGHFGKRPIRLAWFCLVFPSLLLNYFGQVALELVACAHRHVDGRVPVRGHIPFLRERDQVRARRLGAGSDCHRRLHVDEHVEERALDAERGNARGLVAAQPLSRRRGAPQAAPRNGNGGVHDFVGGGRPGRVVAPPEAQQGATRASGLDVDPHGGISRGGGRHTSERGATRAGFLSRHRSLRLHGDAGRAGSPVDCEGAGAARARDGY